MIRESEFVQSHRPYAVDLASLRYTTRTRQDGSHYYSGRIDAVWFRRRRNGGSGPMATVACIGNLWDLQDTEPTTGREFLEAHKDGRHGGDCEGRWDGEKYWGSQFPDVAAQHLAILRPMLAAYPACPEPYSGWWRF